MNRTQEGNRRELRILLVGKPGAGKSATGNTILGQKIFDSKLQARTTTVTCQRGYCTWRGWTVSVTDTADILDTGTSNKGLEQEIRLGLSLCRPGPHTLVFVTQVGRFTAEDEEAARQVQTMFGVEATNYMIILFTRKEDLGGDSLQDYVMQSENEALRNLIQECGGRFCAFNNRAAIKEREDQVSKLMEMVLNMIAGNPRPYLETSIMEDAFRSYLAGGRKRGPGKARRGVSYTKIFLAFCLLGAGLYLFFYQRSRLSRYLPFSKAGDFQSQPPGSL